MMAGFVLALMRYPLAVGGVLESVQLRLIEVVVGTPAKFVTCPPGSVGPLPVGMRKSRMTAMCCMPLAPLSPLRTGLTAESGVNTRLSNTSPSG